jgi:hypothetical protein
MMSHKLWIPVRWLALAMLEIAKRGEEPSRIVECEELVEMGRKLDRK